MKQSLSEIFSRINAQLQSRNDTNRQTPTQRLRELEQEIDEVRSKLSNARNNYNYVTDPDAIEYYIYLQKAYEVRYDMLVRALKRELGNVS